MQAKATPTERSGLASPSARRMPKPPKMVMKVAQKCPATPMTMAASMMGSMGLTSTMRRPTRTKGLRCLGSFISGILRFQRFQLLLGRVQTAVGALLF